MIWNEMNDDETKNRTKIMSVRNKSSNMSFVEQHSVKILLYDITDTSKLYIILHLNQWKIRILLTCNFIKLLNA